MARKSQRKQNGPRQIGGRHHGQQGSTSGGDRADGHSKAKAIEKLVAPAFSFPFTTTYPPELESSDLMDEFNSSPEPEIRVGAQQKQDLDHKTEFQSLYAPSSGPSDQQLYIPQYMRNHQNHTPISTWEYQTYVEEPFNHLEKVASDCAVPQVVKETFESLDVDRDERAGEFRVAM